MNIGFANGCFDLFHTGHEHFLRECTKHCDYLIVAVNSDRYCTRVKGPDRPVWTWARRMQFVRTIASAVIPFEGREEHLIAEIRPDVVFKGADHAPEFHTALFMRVPGWKSAGREAWDTIPIIVIPRLPGISTSTEIARLGLPGASQEAKNAPP